MCSTGAAMKLTVHPARIPAMPWPRGGRVVRMADGGEDWLLDCDSEVLSVASAV